MIPVFLYGLRQQKTRVPGLSCCFVCVILRLAVLVEHRLVTDRQADRQTRTQGHSIYRASIALRGKNLNFNNIRIQSIVSSSILSFGIYLLDAGNCEQLQRNTTKIPEIEDMF